MGTLQVGDSFDAAVTFLKKRDGIDKVCSRTAPSAGREEGQAFQIQPDGFARNRTFPVSDRCHHHLQVLPLLAWGGSCGARAPVVASRHNVSGSADPKGCAIHR